MISKSRSEHGYKPCNGRPSCRVLTCHLLNPRDGDAHCLGGRKHIRRQGRWGKNQSTLSQNQAPFGAPGLQWGRTISAEIPEAARFELMIHAPFPSDLLTWIGIAFCITQSAIFSGLNLAIFSVSKLRLEVEAAGGNRNAALVLNLRKVSISPCPRSFGATLPSMCFSRYYRIPFWPARAHLFSRHSSSPSLVNSFHKRISREMPCAWQRHWCPC